MPSNIECISLAGVQRNSMTGELEFLFSGNFFRNLLLLVEYLFKQNRAPIFLICSSTMFEFAS